MTVADRPTSVSLPSEITTAMRAHARAEAPREACGIIIGSAPAASGGAPLRWIPTTNVLASSTLYEIDAAELLRISLDADDAGEFIWGIVHSHVASPAVPSTTDTTVAGYPDALYILVSRSTACRCSSGVERFLGKEEVTSSNLVIGSREKTVFHSVMGEILYIKKFVFFIN